MVHISYCETCESERAFIDQECAFCKVTSEDSHLVQKADLLDKLQRQDLELWFGLSYASWLTLPRVLMEAMPEEWKRDMAELLNQYDEAFELPEPLGTRVQTTKNGKLVKTPKWLLNYRRPDLKFIKSLKTEKWYISKK